ncbi:MAG TPA: F0F1 ATP synthase subunit gamma [Geminicoccaceae bacterium]
MPSLKDMRVRINSVRQTRKITSAMKLVAASKLKRAQEQAVAARPFSERMASMLANLSQGVAGLPGAPPLLAGTGKDEVHLLLVATADRGHAGGFNSSIVRGARRWIREQTAAGKQVKLLTVGRKGRDMLRRDHRDKLVEHFDGVVGKRRAEFADVQAMTDRLLAMYEAGEFDTATVIYNKFKSAVTQIVTLHRLIPVEAPPSPTETPDQAAAGYEFEPDEERILSELLPRNVAVQIYGAVLENSASEQGARMAAMDSATRNAGDMINRMTLQYNRQRQAQITKELIEIISGAEAAV